MKIRYILVLIIFLGIIGIFEGKFLLQEHQQDKISDQNIPQITRPDNFIQIKRDIQRGVFYDFENLTRDYYLQPDFYPSYRQNELHDYSRWGVHGYGAFPGEISYNVDNFKKGQYVDIFTFVRAGEDIETFQGMMFGIDSQNVSLFDIDISPKNVMFTPTFPERSEYSVNNRTYDWAYKLKVRIIAKSNISSGVYYFKLKSLVPEEDIQKLYYSDVIKINQTQYTCPGNQCDKNNLELRKNVYVDGGQFQADKFFNIIINVGKD